ncbi:hypothetical protein H7171_01060 [Candidatus Saccharibacteria bacterium]|nr:hypothetical protein [Candidatus Saccharibacteria bacterium]
MPKLANIEGFANVLVRYDIITKRSAGHAKVYPFTELGLGILFLTGFMIDSPVANLTISGVVIVITATVLVVIGRSLRAHQDMFCACLGAAFKFPLSKVATVENSVMIIMAFSMIGFYGSMYHVAVVLDSEKVMHAQHDN